MQKKDTFILGAGSSNCYGLPTGKGLKDLFRNLSNDTSIDPNDGIVSDFKTRVKDRFFNNNFFDIDKDFKDIRFPPDIRNQYGYQEFLLSTFNKEFVGSGLVSIDSFLTANQKWEKLGKYLINIAIYYFQFSRFGELILFNQDDNWLQAIFNKYLPLGVTEDEIFKQVEAFPQIITFNYDTLFERGLFNRLKFAHGLTNERANEFIGKLSIHHVYGSIEGGNTDFSKSFQITQLNVGSVHVMRALPEEPEASTAQTISEYYKNTNRLFILGFGFDEQNCHILFNLESFLQHINKANIYGSKFGIDDYTANRVYRTTNHLVIINRNNKRFHESCIDVIKYTS